MSGIALSLVLISALAHALWNLLAKRSADRLAFLWLLNLSVAVLGAPVAALAVAGGAVAASGWVYVIGTGLLHIAYFSALGLGYTRGDLSLVYPVARGTGPLLVTILAIPIFGEVPSTVGAAGIALVLLGIYCSHLPGLERSALAAPLRHAIGDAGSRYALLTGLVICAYTLWDRAAVGIVPPLVYCYFVFTIPALGLAPWMLGRRALTRQELRRWAPSAVLGGVLSYGAYALVLTAFTMSKVSYVAAAREIGIVFGALLGALVLKEKHGAARVAGAVLVFLGVSLIGLAR